MVRTPSNMVSLGSMAPDFDLPDTVWEKNVCRDDALGQNGLLVMFICNHCPYVIHIEQALADLGRDFAQSGIGIVAISANNVETHPQDGPELMREKAKSLGYLFPYLYDEDQVVARAYQAACTPDFFLYDRDLKLVYRGQFDDSRPGNDEPVTGKDLRAAMLAVCHDRPVPEPQIPSLGCNIKWKET